MLCFLFLWGINVAVLKRFKIPYAHLLSLPPDVATVSGARYMYAASGLFAMLAAFFYLYGEAQVSTLNPDLLPSLFYILVILMLLWPGSRKCKCVYISVYVCSAAVYSMHAHVDPCTG